MTKPSPPDTLPVDKATRRFGEFQNPYRLLLASATTVFLVGLLALLDPERISSALPTALIVLGVATPFCAVVVHDLCRAERRGAVDARTLGRRAVQTSGALGLCVLALTFLTGRSPTGRNDLSATFVPHGLCLFVASLAAGTFLGRRWAAQRATHPDEPTRVAFDPVAGASIGSAAGWTLGFGGTFLWQAITGGTGGHFTGIGELFLGLLAMGVGSVVGLLVVASYAKKGVRS